MKVLLYIGLLYMPMIMWSVFVCLLFGWVWMMIVFVVGVLMVGVVCSVARVLFLMYTEMSVLYVDV